jgi:hypothetical protein
MDKQRYHDANFKKNGNELVVIWRDGREAIDKGSELIKVSIKYIYKGSNLPIVINRVDKIHIQGKQLTHSNLLKLLTEPAQPAEELRTAERAW